MKKVNANNLLYIRFDIMYNKEYIHGLYTEERVDDNTIPDGIYKYEIRTNDDGSGNFVTIEPSVIVNFGGTVLLNKEINFDVSFNPNDLFFDIEDKYNINFDLNNPPISLEKYMKGVY